MTVARILEKKGYRVFTVGEAAPVKDIVKQLAQHRIGVLVVTDAAGQATGIVSERDIIAELAHGDGSTKTAAELMTRNVIKCSPDDSEIDLMERMGKARIRHLPVQHGSRLVGVISARDILNLRIEKMSELMNEIMAEVTLKSG